MNYSPPADRFPVLQNIVATVAAIRDERTIAGERFDVSRRYLPRRLEVGDTSYLLRSQFVGTYLPGRTGKLGEFHVPQFAPYFLGRGHNPDEAFADWQDQVHAQFQELYSKRPFEMTDEEADLWQTLGSLIDVATYKKTTPVVIRQIGKVLQCRPFPQKVEWEDGHKELVRLDQMPGEFATYKPGQPFEAIVARDPVDLRMIKASYVRRVAALHSLSDDEQAALLQEIPGMSSLQEADWD